jgi:hypothetical protein
MPPILKPLALMLLLALPGTGQASIFEHPVVGDVREAITTTLEGQGYQVFTVERERGGYEVKAAREGRLWELRLNAGYEIVRIELED